MRGRCQAWLMGVAFCSLGLLAGCERSAGARDADANLPAGARVAVSNSYLQAAVRELLGADEPVVLLAPPGMCPGHYDLRPSHFRALASCRLLLRFDFQSTLDGKLAGLVERGLSITPVTAEGGLGIPATYRAVCGQVATALAEAGLMEATSAAERLVALDVRLGELAGWAESRLRAAGLVDREVVASTHQAAFCEHLGLKATARFRSADLTTIDEVTQAVNAGLNAAAIVANASEGTRQAEALAARTGVPLVVLVNFPDEAQHGLRFDGLYRDNVQRLIAAADR